MGWIAAGLAAGLLTLLPAPGGARAAPGPQLVVAFAADGRFALHACAHELTARGRPFRDATADRSDSLDHHWRRLGVRRVVPLFRRSDGRPFAAQRRALRERLEAARDRRARGRRAVPAAAALPDLSHVYVIELPPGADPARAAARLRTDAHVLWAQPDLRADADAFPDDPFFFSSGSWGQPYPDLWGLLRIRADLAWGRTLGEGALVAVIDTGIDYEHPDIAANIWVNPGEDLDGDGVAEPSDRNGIDDDANGFVDDLHGFDFFGSLDANGDGDFDDPGDISDGDPFDDNGHGTHVGGTLAAVGGNGVGILGVAPRAGILPLKALGASGSGNFSTIARAIVYAAEMGADAINASFTCGGRCPSNPVGETAVRLAHALGVVYVTSAGNKQDDLVFYSPERLRESIVVAASDENDDSLASSSVGLLVDVAAPGGGSGAAPPELAPERNVLSLKASASTPGLDGAGAFVVADAFLRLSGTSMAAPHVAGLAALLRAEHPELDPDEVRALLRLGAIDLGRPGHDPDTGAGRIDAESSLALAPPPRMRGWIASPEPGAVASQRAGALEIAGTAAGEDLAEYALFYGRSLTPRSWMPIGEAREDPVEDGVLGHWPVAELANGAYALRLVLVARDGTRREEFAPLSLERNPPLRISSPGAPATAPAVSGRLVVWESERAPEGEPADGDGRNVFLSDLARGTERAIAAASGDQEAATVSGTLVAWRDGRRGSPEIFGCRYDPRSGRCPAHALGSGELPSPPDASGTRIAWSDGRDGAPSLRVCEAHGSARVCGEMDLGSQPATRVRLDGTRLTWRAPGRALFTCALGPGRRDCPARRIADVGALSHDVAGDLIAWGELISFDTTELRLCALERDACPSILVDDRELEPRPALSGHRLVWNSRRRRDDLDIFFCEFDRVTRTCPPQRLTGSAAPQRNPAIDGTLVVWEDLRSGVPEIFGLELPSLAPLRDRVVRTGDTLVVRVSGRAPAGEALGLSAAQADGRPVAELGATFVDFGAGRGELRWTPEPDQAGSYAVTFAGTTTGRLATRATIRIEVRRGPGLAGGALPSGMRR